MYYNNEFTKNCIKVGYMVELRNGELSHVIPTLEHGIVFSSDRTWMGIELIDNELKSEIGGAFDIVKVYGLTKCGFDAHKFITKNRELLWERAERKEMAQQEIEEEFGYKIKLI